MGSRRLPANMQETKQIAAAACPRLAWDFARYLHVLTALLVTVQPLRSLPRWQLSQRNDLMRRPKLHTQLYHAAVSASACSQPVFSGALSSWVLKSGLMSSRYTRHLLEITLFCLGQGAAFCLQLPSASPAPGVIDKHQPNTQWQANWVLALGSISLYIFFTTTQLKNKPSRNQNTKQGLWMGCRTIWTWKQGTAREVGVSPREDSRGGEGTPSFTPIRRSSNLYTVV